jgi:uncharacterized protein involved in outer membrane biogenesis
MKRLALLVLVIIGLIGLAIAAAPLIAATDMSKRRIANQIEEWTGHRVTFVGEPRVKLFPFLTLTIEDAKIGGEAGPDGEPFVAMDKLTCKLRLLPFLMGRAEVAEFQLVRPVFRLMVDAAGNANWVPGKNSLASEARTATTPDQIAEIKLGRFKIVDGTIIYDNRQDDRHEELDQLRLDLRWPELAEPVSGIGAFNWRNELVEFNIAVSQPLDLIAGDASPARFGIASRPVRVSFTGTANGLATLQLEGETTVTTPSVRRVVEWLGVPMESGPILGAGLIEGDLNWIGPSLTFPTAHIELDGNVADGSVSIDLSRQRPRMQGTLALERLDLSAYLETLQATINADGGWQAAPTDMPLLDLADLDIRLSAGEILVGSVRIGKSAAAVTVNDGRLDVDIGEAQFYGGSLEGDAWVKAEGGAAAGSARIALENTPAAVALADLLGLSLVEGATSARIALDGEGETWGDFAATLSGTADVDISDGALVGFDLGHFAELSGAYDVADPAPGSGTVPLTSLTAKLTLADGKLTGEDIVVAGNGFTITLGGEVSMIDLGVRAKGVLNAKPAKGDADSRRDIPFVVSGSWYSPFLLPDYERLIRRGASEEETTPPVGTAAWPTAPNG